MPDSWLVGFFVCLNYFQLLTFVACAFVIVGIRRAYVHKDVRSDPFIYIAYLSLQGHMIYLVFAFYVALYGIVHGNDLKDIISMPFLWLLYVYRDFLSYVLNIMWFLYFFLHSAFLRLFKPPHSSLIAPAAMAPPAHFMVMNILVRCKPVISIPALIPNYTCSTHFDEFFLTWKKNILFPWFDRTHVAYVTGGALLLWRWLRFGHLDPNRYKFAGSFAIAFVTNLWGVVFECYPEGYIAPLFHNACPIIFIATIFLVDTEVRFYSLKTVADFFNPTIHCTISTSLELSQENSQSSETTK